MATSFTPGTFSAWLAAPEPRPPQPMRAILISSLAAPNAKRSMARLPIMAPPMAVLEVERKPRRDRTEALAAGMIWLMSLKR